MEPWTTMVAVLCLATLVATVTVARDGHPGPKRTWLYETPDGERVNPFKDLWDGAVESDNRCRGCGTMLESPTYSFCGTCGPTSVADD